MLVTQRLDLLLRLGVVDRLARVHNVNQQLLVRHGVRLVDMNVLQRELRATADKGVSLGVVADVDDSGAPDTARG